MNTGTCSLDIRHVAAAKVVRAAEIVSFDARQRTLAAAVGLRVAPLGFPKCGDRKLTAKHIPGGPVYWCGTV